MVFTDFCSDHIQEPTDPPLPPEEFPPGLKDRRFQAYPSYQLCKVGNPPLCILFDERENVFRSHPVFFHSSRKLQFAIIRGHLHR
jgi:hypothetical protein